MVAGLVEYLVRSNEFELKDITMITPYNGQLAAFSKRLGTSCSLWLNQSDREKLLEEGLFVPEDMQADVEIEVGIRNMPRLATIDSFQGEESKVVILSLVRSNIEGRTGFLRTPNRVNVACSRAKCGLYIFGNASLMRGVDMWEQISGAWIARGRMGTFLRVCCPRHPDKIHHIRSPEQ